MRTAPCNSSKFSLFRIFFNLLYYRQMELCIPQFFEEAGLFVISRSTVQIRVLAPEKSRGYIKRCNPLSRDCPQNCPQTVRTAFLRLGNFAPLLEKYSNMRTLKAFPHCRFFFFPSLLPQYATIHGMFSQRPPLKNKGQQQERRAGLPPF